MYGPKFSLPENVFKTIILNWKCLKEWIGAKSLKTLPKMAYKYLKNASYITIFGILSSSCRKLIENIHEYFPPFSNIAWAILY